ncbi:unnamed protein product [Paramecium sonneborni]|uniref:Uncharacterized protein n=1 Tax=Paramecium sonneborni TaxID=65129 RepID=A0A8S1MSL7_9CILI|nr:unnamed protein product [Paramecium sonneborni]
MNLNRIPLAPLTPIQVQQLARLPKVLKNQNNYNRLISTQNNMEQSKCLSSSYKIKIYKKIVLELLNSIQNTPFLEFIYGLHVEFKSSLQFHIYPTESLINSLSLHFDIKQLYKIYDNIFKENNTKIKIYINISEIDLILQFLRSIVKQMPHISRIREVLKYQTVRDVLNIKKTEIEDPKLNQIVTMIQYIFNPSLIKINCQIIIKKEQQENLIKDISSTHILRNVQQIVISLFLNYCLQRKLFIPEIIYSLKTANNFNSSLTLDPNFINDIPYSSSYDEFKEKIKFRRFQRIFNLQELIEYEYYLIQEFQISYPMKSLENILLETINLVNQNYYQIIDRLKRIVLSQRIEIMLENLTSQSLSQIGMNILTTISSIQKTVESNDANQFKKIPQIKLKIKKL